MELRELQRVLARSGAGWEAGETSLSNATVDPEGMEMLGYVPGPDEPSLDEQEALGQASLENFLVQYSRPYPDQHDWRDVNGASFVDPVRDQSRCGACVAFGSCAVVEGTFRVEQGAPGGAIDLSEAHLFYCIARQQGRRCAGRDVGG